MKKILIFLVWLLGLAAIAWLCNGMNAVVPAAAPPGADAAAVASPPTAKVALEPARAPVPASAPAPAVVPAAAAAAAVPSLAVQAAASRIDQVLKNKLVEFRSGSATLTAIGRATLADIAPVLKDNPSLKFEAQGHTDATGTEAINLALSQARANAVKAYLVKQGITPARVGAQGYGSSQPVADNTTAAGRARNRRMAFKIEENK